MEPYSDDELDRWFSFDQICYDVPPASSPERDQISPENSQGDALQAVGTAGPLTPALPIRGARRANIARVARPKPPFAVVCFPANPLEPNGLKKKRKDFQEARRKEVALVRRKGACFQCRARKTTVRAPIF
jgi:hypothetical protein